MYFISKLTLISLTVAAFGYSPISLASSKLDSAKKVAGYAREALSFAADTKEVFGNGSEKAASDTGTNPGSNAIAVSINQAIEINGFTAVDSKIDLNAILVEGSTVFVMVANQAVQITGGGLDGSEVFANVLDISDSIAGYIGVDQKLTLSGFNAINESELNANLVFIDGAKLGFFDLTQVLSAYNVTFDNTTFTGNTVSWK